MKIDFGKILYVSTHSPDSESGVEKKIQGICNIAQVKGFSIERLTKNCKTINARKELLNEALKSDAGIIIIRSLNGLTITVSKYLKEARRQGRILICDQPTPLSVVLKETWHSKSRILKRLYSISWGIISGPWAMRHYNRIIEYAPEGLYFRLGNERRIKLIGNGIDITRIKERKPKIISDGHIRLVGVANTSIHHGYDRVIKAIYEYNKLGDNKAYFEIIGGASDSPMICQLKQLVKDLNIADYVTFAGFKEQDYIMDAYSRSDIAIGSLGLSRIGLEFSSILKAREYCLAGIPFITAGKDPDFINSGHFRYEVPNDNSIQPIVKVLLSFAKNGCKCSDEEIREYAVKNLGFDKKFDQMMEGLL